MRSVRSRRRRALDSPADVLARAARDVGDAVDAAHLHPELGREDDLVAATLERPRRSAARCRRHRRRCRRCRSSVMPASRAASSDRARRVEVEPAAEVVAAEAERGDLERPLALADPAGGKRRRGIAHLLRDAPAGSTSISRSSVRSRRRLATSSRSSLSSSRWRRRTSSSCGRRSRAPPRGSRRRRPVLGLALAPLPPQRRPGALGGRQLPELLERDAEQVLEPQQLLEPLDVGLAVERWEPDRGRPAPAGSRPISS